MKKNVLKTVMLLLLSVYFYSCKEDTTVVEVNSVTLGATLSGSSEVPANNSMAGGSFSINYNKVTKIMVTELVYSGMNATAMHIHRGRAGVNGGVQWGLANPPFTQPVVFTSPALNQSQEDSLMNGLYYVNVHSAAFPGGEIRGQILKQ